nr:immunoglobulin light chain junction region [Macaca mulatta]MOW41358.1 immunoglobulin light chain junction region [Macaca mulatta]
CQQGYDVLTF